MRSIIRLVTRITPAVWKLSAGSTALLVAMSPATARSAQVPPFHPVSVTFASPAQGWVLGTGGCSMRVCLKLYETTDAGASWSARRLPAALVATRPMDRGVLEVRFADPRDGWIYGAPTGGSPTLWSTHNGGKAWLETRPGWLGRRSAIFDLEATAGRAYLLGSDDAGKVTLAGAATTGDDWHILSTPELLNPAGGGEQLGSLVLQGRSGWLLEGNDRGPTGSAHLDASRRWVAWTPPCAAVGNTFAVPAAANARSLVAVCVMGGFAFPISKAAPPGATIASTWLYVSEDGGDTFVAGPELSRRPLGGDVLASPVPGVVLLAEPRGLAQSLDGGAHWTVVYRGNLVYLGFTTPTQGVGIAVSPSGAANTTRLIMSYDGGRHWKQVGP